MLLKAARLANFPWPVELAALLDGRDPLSLPENWL